jgi:hypothetical protein
MDDFSMFFNLFRVAALKKMNASEKDGGKGKLASASHQLYVGGFRVKRQTNARLVLTLD